MSRSIHQPAFGAVVSLAAALVLAGCGRGAAPGNDDPRIPPGTPIILISIDTLRSDRLPAYGYDKVATPAIDELRKDGVLFRHAFTPIPLTLPAHASMLTGRLPYEHGIRDNQGYVLGERWPVLPELLARHGYRSAAAVSTFILRRETGLARGFELYDDHLSDAPDNQVVSPLRPGRETLVPALAWLKEVADEPFFLFFHLYEPHLPYQPDEDLRSRYGASYDAEVATADRVIGQLLAGLRDLGIYQRAMIILTSDHGEGLGEHGLFEHGPLLYREALQIPLIVKLPAGVSAPATSERPAQLIDLVPTIFDLIGEHQASSELPGAALFDQNEGRRTLYAETLFPRLHFGWSELYSLIDYPYHLIDGPDPELYDLAADPAETRNILSENRRQYRQMADGLEALPLEFVAPGPVDEETLAKLAALGYVGSSAKTAGGGPRADPKSKLHVLKALSEALGHFRRGDCPETIAALGVVVAEEPEIIEAWDHLGLCHMRLGRPAEALEYYERFMKLTGGSPKAALGAATALFALDRLDEARQLAETATSSQPVAFSLLAKIAVRNGDLEAAEQALTRALESTISRADALLSKAELMLAKDDPEAAVAMVRQAEAAAKKPLRGLAFIRGNALARLGEIEPATTAFRAAIEESPNEIAPYTHLALLRGLAGDAASAIAALRELVETNPTPAAYAEAVRTLRLLGDDESAGRLLAFARGKWPQNEMLRSL